MLNFVDDYSGMVWIYPLKKKSDAFASFQEWKALVTNKTGKHIKIFHTDNGGEYISESFAHYLHNEGINHQTTRPHTSAKNGNLNAYTGPS